MKQLQVHMITQNIAIYKNQPAFRGFITTYIELTEYFGFKKLHSFCISSHIGSHKYLFFNFQPQQKATDRISLQVRLKFSFLFSIEANVKLFNFI